MTEEQFKEAISYANDPATDRTFMAIKIFELLLKISGDKFFSEDLLINLLRKSFILADEFVRQSNPEGTTK